MAARIRINYANRSSLRSGGYLILVFGLIVLLGGLFLGVRSAFRSIYWKHTAVTVFKFTENKTMRERIGTGGRRTRTIYTYPCINFTAHANLAVRGAIYELTFPAGSRPEDENSGPDFRAGTIIPILYNPEDPNSYEKSDYIRFLGPILFMLFGGWLTFLGFKIKNKEDSTDD